ncbi:MAG: hypothetical protein WBV37_13670 [Nocardioidaceae bacterium]
MLVRINRAVAVASVIVVLTVAAGLLVSHVLHHDSRIESALRTIPEQTLVANFTDWSAVRSALAPEIASTSPAGERASLFARAYDRDFTTTSVLGVFDPEMATTYGWTVLDSTWEMYGQSRDGAVDVLRMSAGFDFAAADRALTKLGYAAGVGGVRVADAGAMVAIAPDLTPQLTAIALLPDEGLIVTSDTPAYAGLTLATISGSAPSVYDGDVGVRAMSAALTDTSVSALMDVGTYSCTAAGFGQADAGEREVARQRISEVGGVAETQGLTLSIAAGRSLTVVLNFASPDQAAADLAPRRALARGVAPAQGGTFEERFSIAGAGTVGSEIVLVLDPRTPDTQLLRDLGRGGLLFASC